MRIFNLLVALSFFVSPVMAGESDTLIPNKSLKYDTNYILSNRDWIHLKLVGVNTQTSIDLVNTEIDYNLLYRSNNPFRFGIGLDYEWIGLEYSQTIRGFELDNEAKGNTDSYALKIGLSGRRFSGNLYYRESTGFSQENIRQLYPDWFETESYYPYSADLRSQTINGSLNYTFNHRKFSNAAAMRQIDRQIKSAGSAVVGIVSNFEGFYSPIPIITQDSLQGRFLDFKKAEYVKVGITGGYMYTFSFGRNFYLHAALIPGVLYSYGDVLLHHDDRAHASNTIGGSLYGRFAMGYNAERFYGGIYAIADSYSGDVFATQHATTAYSYFKIYVGYRFFHVKKKKWMKFFFLD